MAVLTIIHNLLQKGGDPVENVGVSGVSPHAPFAENGKGCHV